MTSRALLVGINAYDTVSDLRGCRNDAADMRRLLVETLGFDHAGVRVLLDAEATKPAILDGLRWLADARPGDRRCFHFSGHGSYLPDASGDETDGLDEILCLPGMNFADPRTYLTDDEIGAWQATLPPGVRLLQVHDSCHSGTGTRELIPPGSRSLPPAGPARRKCARVVQDDTAARAGIGAAAAASRDLSAFSPQLVVARFAPPPSPPGPTEGQAQSARQVARLAPRRRKPRVRAIDGADVLAVAACQPDQTAADAYFPGPGGTGIFQGALTRALTAALRVPMETPPTASGLRRRLTVAMKSGQFSQVPDVEEAGRGAAALLRP